VGILCLWQALLIISILISQVLGEKAFAAHGKYFVSMHFTDNAPPPKKKALSFVFNLPPTDKMEDLTRLVSLIPFYIDLVGRLRLTAQVSSTSVGDSSYKALSFQVLGWPLFLSTSTVCFDFDLRRPWGNCARLLRKVPDAFFVLVPKRFPVNSKARPHLFQVDF
jgi:hypothetical protein